MEGEKLGDSKLRVCNNHSNKEDSPSSALPMPSTHALHSQDNPGDGYHHDFHFTDYHTMSRQVVWAAQGHRDSEWPSPCPAPHPGDHIQLSKHMGACCPGPSRAVPPLKHLPRLVILPTSALPRAPPRTPLLRERPLPPRRAPPKPPTPQPCCLF